MTSAPAYTLVAATKWTLHDSSQVLCFSNMLCAMYILTNPHCDPWAVAPVIYKAIFPDIQRRVCFMSLVSFSNLTCNAQPLYCELRLFLKLL